METQMGDILIKVLVCFIAGAGAGIGTGFAGMSAAAVIGPMLITFLGIWILVSLVLAKAILAMRSTLSGSFRLVPRKP